jgi:hypothetical protein
MGEMRRGDADEASMTSAVEEENLPCSKPIVTVRRS